MEIKFFLAMFIYRILRKSRERKVVCVHLILDHIQKTWCSKEFYESFYFSKNLYFTIIPLKNNFELETKKNEGYQ